MCTAHFPRSDACENSTEFSFPRILIPLGLLKLSASLSCTFNTPHTQHKSKTYSSVEFVWDKNCESSNQYQSILWVTPPPGCLLRTRVCLSNKLPVQLTYQMLTAVLVVQVIVIQGSGWPLHPALLGPPTEVPHWGERTNPGGGGGRQTSL